MKFCKICQTIFSNFDDDPSCPSCRENHRIDNVVDFTKEIADLLGIGWNMMRGKGE